MSEQLELRVALLEAEVARLKSSLEGGLPPSIDSQPWWEKIVGTFADDPTYDEAMQSGREYRDSLRSEDDEVENSKVIKPIAAPIMSPILQDTLSPEDSKTHKG